MQKRLKLHKVLILVLAFLISVILITTIVGRNSTVQIVVVKGEIDRNKFLDEQLNKFKTIKVLKSELKNFNGTVVLSTKELKGKKLMVDLKDGSPVLKDVLTTSDSAGEFAMDMAIEHTTYQIKGGKDLLPPGVKAGDRINVGLSIQKNDQNGQQHIETGILLKNVYVFDVKDKDVYLKVSSQEHLDLATAEKLGTFVLQLPGQKEVKSCDIVQEEVRDTVKKNIEKLKKQNPDKEYNEEDMFQKAMNDVDCVDPTDNPTSVSQDDIINRIENSPTTTTSTTTLTDDQTNKADKSNQEVVDDNKK